MKQAFDFLMNGDPWEIVWAIVFGCLFIRIVYQILFD